MRRCQGEDTNRAASAFPILEEDSGRSQGDDVVEVGLLLPAGQLLALEEAAHECGLSAGEMFRQMLQSFLAGPAAAGRAVRANESVEALV